MRTLRLRSSWAPVGFAPLLFALFLLSACVLEKKDESPASHSTAAVGESASSSTLNVSLFNSNNITGRQRVECGVLRAGQSLQTKEYIRSCDGKFLLIAQDDGHLVLYGPYGPIWGTITYLAKFFVKGSRLTLTNSGNLRLIAITPDNSEISVWDSHTDSEEETVLVVADGRIALFRAAEVGLNQNPTPIWSSLTHRRCGSLLPGQGLERGERVSTCFGDRFLEMSGDGNLRYFQGNTVLLERGSGRGRRAILQWDGNFVLYDDEGKALFQTGTSGESDGNYRMVLTPNHLTVRRPIVAWLNPFYNRVNVVDGGSYFYFASEPPFLNATQSTVVGDFSGTGAPQLAVGAGPGGGPRVTIFNGLSQTEAQQRVNFFAYEPTFSGGVTLSVGDVNGDGADDLVAYPRGRVAPRITVFSGKDGSPIGTFFAFDPTYTNGIKIAVGDFRVHGRAQIAVSSPVAGAAARLQLWELDANGQFQLLSDNFVIPPSRQLDGLNIGAMDPYGVGHPVLAYTTRSSSQVSFVLLGGEQYALPPIEVTTNQLINLMAREYGATATQRTISHNEELAQQHSTPQYPSMEPQLSALLVDYRANGHYYMGLTSLFVDAAGVEPYYPRLYLNLLIINGQGTRTSFMRDIYNSGNASTYW